MRKFSNIVFTVVVVIIMASTMSFAASISGLVSYEGQAPKFREIKMDADPVCVLKHGKPVYPQTLELGENNEMANVFVHVISGLPKKDFTAPVEPLILDQKGCMYDPHVAGVMVGQPVKFLNPDGTLHNVHALSKINPEFNLAMPKFRKETSKTFDKAEFMFPIKCDVHPWMISWVSVMDHPYFNVTGKDGQFTIDNLPAGTYEIEAWHEKLGTKKMSVTVSADENKTADVTFSRPGK